MKILICIYLLLKAGLNRRMTWFDIGLAKVVSNEIWIDMPPTYVIMIANLTREEHLPEAWADFVYGIFDNS